MSLIDTPTTPPNPTVERMAELSGELLDLLDEEHGYPVLRRLARLARWLAVELEQREERLKNALLYRGMDFRDWTLVPRDNHGQAPTRPPRVGR